MKQKKKVHIDGVLKVIAICLIVAGVICIINGVISVISDAASRVDNFVGGYDDFDFDDYYEESFVSFDVFRNFKSVFSGFVCFVWAIVLLVISKSIKTNRERNAEMEFVDAVSNPQIIIQKQEERRYFCAYCGNELFRTDRMCQSCGASKKIEKIEN